MFFCDFCANKRNWPESMSKSYGVCEICDITARCNDVPSSALPMPAKVIEPEYVGRHRKIEDIAADVVKSRKDMLEKLKD